MTPQQMRADVDQLVATLRDRHPGLHRYMSEDAFGAAVKMVHAQVAEPMRDLQFFRVLSPLVAGIQCGHTAMRPSGEFLQAIATTAKQLPCRVRFVGDRTYVSQWQEPSEQRVDGCELLSIDGCPLSQLRARMLPCIRGDGAIASGKLRELEKQFALYYSMFIDTKVDKPFLLQVRSNGGAPQEVSVPGCAFRPPTRANLGAPIEWQLHDDGIGLLTVRTFSSGAMKRATVDYRKFLAETFAEIRGRDVQRLIVDLRGNSGGTDQMGAMLASYLCSRPFGYFAEIEVTPSFAGRGRVQTAADGRRLLMGHPGLRVQQPAADAFTGELIMLIDGNTFSTAADVATVVHFQKAATFLGEECGGGYDGNNSGMMHTEVLKHSQIAVRVPQWKYTTAVPGHKYAGRGVPAEAIDATIEDLMAGEDPVLEAALSRLRKG